MLWEQLRMSFGYMPFPFLCQFDFSLQIRTRKPTHYGSPCDIGSYSGP
jgi:hypothetical protein